MVLTHFPGLLLIPVSRILAFMGTFIFSVFVMDIDRGIWERGVIKLAFIE